MPAQSQEFRFVDLFAGLGGFHYGLKRIGGKCVFACEKDELLRELYALNHEISSDKIFGDIEYCKEQVPDHDLLVAGFPCQPFSKSGKQMGFNDAERGGCIFHAIDILRSKRPQCFIFENVGNLSRHDDGRTWKTIKKQLHDIGYCVRSTADELIQKQAEKHLSPHLYGYPQRRERFFAVGSLSYLPKDPFPVPTEIQPSLRSIMEHPTDPTGGLNDEERKYTKLQKQAELSIELWNMLISSLPKKQRSLPSFPIWLEEYDASYPYVTQTPYDKWCNQGLGRDKIALMLEELPPYAREKGRTFPLWKVKFIDQNREWIKRHRDFIDPSVVKRIRELDHTYRKLEWNVRESSSSNIWDHTIQTRPSGIRVSNPNYIPTVVSIVSSQTPIYGQYRRHLTAREIARAFGFPEDIRLPTRNSHATKALGNAVHADVVRLVAARLIGYSKPKELELHAEMEAVA